MPLPIVATVLLVFALAAFIMGAVVTPPGRVNLYIGLGLAFLTLAFLLKG